MEQENIIKEIYLNQIKDAVLKAVKEVTYQNPSVAEQLTEKVEKIFEQNLNPTKENDNEYSFENYSDLFSEKNTESDYSSNDYNSDDFKNSVHEVEEMLSNITSGKSSKKKPKEQHMYTIPITEIPIAEESSTKKKTTTRKPRTKKTSAEDGDDTKETTKKTTTRKPRTKKATTEAETTKDDTLHTSTKKKPSTKKKTATIVEETTNPVDVNSIVDEMAKKLTQPVETTPIVENVVKPIETTPIVEDAVKPVETTSIVEDVVKPVETTPIVENVVKPIETTPIVEDAVKPVETTPVVENVVKPVDINSKNDYKTDTTATTSKFGFNNSATPATSRFGATNNTTPATSRFGSANNTPATSRFGSTNNTPATSRFGATNNTTPATSRFGATNNTTPATSRFGANNNTIPSTNRVGSYNNSFYSADNNSASQNEKPVIQNNTTIQKPQTTYTSTNTENKPFDTTGLVSAHKLTSNEPVRKQNPVDLTNVVIDENCTDPIGGLYGIDDEKPLTGSFTLSEKLEDTSQKSVDDLDVPLEGSFDVEPAKVTVSGKFVENTKPTVTMVDSLKSIPNTPTHTVSTPVSAPTVSNASPSTSSNVSSTPVLNNSGLVSAHKLTSNEPARKQNPVDLTNVVIDENCTDPIGGLYGLDDEKPLTGSFTLSEKLEDTSQKSVDDLNVPLEGSFDVEPAKVTVSGKFVENTKPTVTMVDSLKSIPNTPTHTVSTPVSAPTVPNTPPVSVPTVSNASPSTSSNVPSTPVLNNSGLVSAHKLTSSEPVRKQNPVDLTNVVIDENCTDPIGGLYGIDDEKPLTGSFTLSEKLEDTSQKSVDDLDVPLEGSFDVEPAEFTVSGKFIENTKPTVTMVGDTVFKSSDNELEKAIQNAVSSKEFLELVKKELEKNKK